MWENYVKKLLLILQISVLFRWYTKKQAKSWVHLMLLMAITKIEIF